MINDIKFQNVDGWTFSPSKMLIMKEMNYEEIVEINFKQIPSAMDIFSGDLKVDNMVMAMSVFDDGKCKSIR